MKKNDNNFDIQFNDIDKLHRILKIIFFSFLMLVITGGIYAGGTYLHGKFNIFIPTIMLASQDDEVFIEYQEDVIAQKILNSYNVLNELGKAYFNKNELEKIEDNFIDIEFNRKIIDSEVISIEFISGGKIDFKGTEIITNRNYKIKIKLTVFDKNNYNNINTLYKNATFSVNKKNKIIEFRKDEVNLLSPIFVFEFFNSSSFQLLATSYTDMITSDNTIIESLHNIEKLEYEKIYPCDSYYCIDVIGKNKNMLITFYIKEQLESLVLDEITAKDIQH